MKKISLRKYFHFFLEKLIKKINMLIYMYVLALIPARGGSKGIKMKNIKEFNGKPLIYWSIKIAKECKFINRTIVSTDN